MKTRMMLILAVALVALGALYYADYGRLVDRRTAEVRQARLIPFESDDIVRLAVRNDHGVFVLEKSGGVWRLVEPVDEAADQAVVAALLKALAEGSKNSPVAVPEDQREAYGFTDDAPRVTVVSQTGETVELTLGADAPIFGDLYLNVASEPSLAYAAPTSLTKTFDKTLLDLRDKAVLRLAPGELERFRIERPFDDWDPTLVFLRDEAGAWLVTPDPDNLEAGPVYRADEPTVLSILDEWLHMRVAEREALPAEPPYVERFALHASLDAQDGATTRTTTFFGPRPVAPIAAQDLDAPSTATVVDIPSTATVGDIPSTATVADAAPSAGIFARTEGRDLLFVAPERLTDLLEAPIETFRDRQVFSMDADDVTYMQIEVLGGAYAFERGEDGLWRFAAQADRPVGQSKVEGYLALCLLQRIETYRPEPPPPSLAAAGLVEPTLTVTLANEDRTVRQGLEIGVRVAPESPLFYARRTHRIDPSGAEPPVVGLTLPTNFLDALLRPSSYFEARELLDFDPEGVHRAEIAVSRRDPETGEEAVVVIELERGEAGGAPWTGTIAEGEAKGLPAATVELFLKDLANVEYVSSVSPETAEIDEAGLGGENAPLSVHVYDAQNDLLAGMEVGLDLGEGTTLLVLSAEGGWYRLNRLALARLFQSFRELAGRLQ